MSDYTKYRKYKAKYLARKNMTGGAEKKDGAGEAKPTREDLK
jgi:hypothetical protein